MTIDNNDIKATIGNIKRATLMLAGANSPAEAMRYVKSIDSHFNVLERDIHRIEDENQGLKEAAHNLAKEVTIEKVRNALG